LTRLPVVAFAALVAATVAAFFITQHLKVSTPLIAGFPRPYPAAINPIGGTTCYDPGTHKYVNYRVMGISFYLLQHSDNVDVWVVDHTGKKIVATLALNRFMPGGSHPVRTQFVWNGREQSGALAPDGTYYVKVRLVHQGRTVTISDNSGPVPFRVITVPPKPVITLVSPRVIHASRPSPIRIGYTGNETRLGTVLIYRIARHRRPTVVKSFLTKGQTAVWNGLIRKQPAAPGTYLIGLQVTDLACNTGYFPATLSPLSPDAAAAEVTVLP
jgi:hypothetical protein